VPEQRSPTLAIVIVSFNVRGDLDACLRALPEALGDVTATTVVVDNGSTDGTIEWLRQQWPETRLIETGSNLGFAKANNVGIRATSSELVLLLNPDTVPMPGALARLVATLRAHPEAAAVGPRLVDAAGHPELSFGRSMSPFGEFRQKTIEGLARRGVAPIQRSLTRAQQTPGAHGWISGACLLARRADLDAVGLLDERYFMYAEDVDLCRAFRRRGRTVRFDPDAMVKHLRGQSAHANPRLEQLRRQSQMAYYRKHHPAWAPLLRWYLRLTGRPI
jgi:N-acetylglucosaminyl-diphospho-decaprenol L-rhamnosyltransferase